MKYLLPYYFIFLSLSVFAQQTPYQAFEVDSAAEPHGGISYLTTFLQTNLRKPIAAEAAGTGGRIIISAIVEPTGTVSNVKAMSSLRPDCDREAVRVFSLFNAWKPAQKDGKAVRQIVNIPVIFRPNTPFIYSNGARISYFDADQKPLADSSDKVRYKQMAPLDTNGFPTGDIVVYKIKGSTWKEDYRIPFMRQKNSRKNSSDQPTTTIGYQTVYKLWEGLVVMLSESGLPISQSYYKSGLPTGIGIQYHPNGAVAQKTDEIEDGFATTTWYANGQIKQIRAESKPKALVKNNPTAVTAYWDSTGHQFVKNGNGQAIYTERVQSRTDTTQQTTFNEQGLYENGFKQGIWTGRYADGSYFYEEQYDKGICLKGKSKPADSDTLHYTDVEQQAEFSGGLPALGQFLAQNLRYPPNAQRSRAQGKIFVSFVVCTDGTLCDYEVIKSVHPDLDEEAVRVVQKMSGRWKPGTRRGQKIRVKYNLPINFTLQ